MLDSLWVQECTMSKCESESAVALPSRVATKSEVEQKPSSASHLFYLFEIFPH